MKKSAHKFLFVAVALVTALTLAVGSRPAAAQGKTKVLWFVGLGSGTNPQQLAAEHKVVDEFNASQDKIELSIQVAPTYETAVDTITTLIAAGTPPDIDGPVGVGNSNRFADRWLDIKPLIEKNKYDLSNFDPALVDLYKTLNGGYSAIPFAIYPTFTYYNQALFDEAGLKYPPTKFGDKYTMPDGSSVDWNYETVAKIAKILTVDKAGNDATSSSFDSKNIVQYGMNFQYGLLRLMLTDIQPSAFYDASTNTIKISDDWRKGIQWLHDGLWKDHFLVNNTADAALLPNAFASGKVGINITPLWYTCCMQDVAGKLKWNLAVVPQSLDGKYHDATDADTFRIDKGSKNPDAAFTVLTYLLDKAVPELAQTYGAFPARKTYQQPWIDGENKIYTQGVDWSFINESLKYTNPSNLHHESDVRSKANPLAFGQVQDRFDAFKTLLFSDSGATMDVNAEIDKLQADLQSIVNGTFPTATPMPTSTPTPAATSAS